MKFKLLSGGFVVAILATTGSLAHAAPGVPEEAFALSSSDRATNERLIRQANGATIHPDAKAGQSAVYSPYGTYPRRKGVILATPDKLKGIIPTGHAAIVYSHGAVVESLSDGVVRGSNDWYQSRKQAYGVTVRGTSADQDAGAADWADAQRGKSYLYWYWQVDRRDKFYCSHLVWAAFKDKYGINMNTDDFGVAIHPMELVNTPKTTLVYRKA